MAAIVSPPAPDPSPAEREWASAVAKRLEEIGRENAPRRLPPHVGAAMVAVGKSLEDAGLIPTRLDVRGIGSAALEALGPDGAAAVDRRLNRMSAVGRVLRGEDE